MDEKVRPAHIYHREEVMGTIITIDLYREAGIDPDAVLGPLTRSVESLHQADKVFSTWKSESPLSKLRRGEISLGETPPEVHDVLEACRHAREISNGWFDPWAMPGGVDPTGYVKGWAADRALRAFEGAPLDGVMVNAAGDIATFGAPAPDEDFHVGIVRPDSPLQLACTVKLVGAIATSGTYERGAHLLDPKTGERRTLGASASVTGPDLGMADALATALSVGGDEVLALIDNLEDYEAFIIDHDGGWRWTTRFPFDETPNAS